MSEFDFSEFHPLDHSVWEPICWGWAGGIPRHIGYWWRYQLEWPWQQHMAKRACDKGNHHVIAYWNKLPNPGVRADGFICRDCDWIRKA
jgi:hypothetical protein